MAEQETSPTGAKSEENVSPIAVLVIGMAGSGKSTFMQRLCTETSAQNTGTYVLNLDPAVYKIPFGANIDIRDTVNYKEVMRQYKLGPNGAIMTSLNLFATRFDQVMNLIEARKRCAEYAWFPFSLCLCSQVKYIFIDTPGQIEVFTWSASGSIITESIASTFPTVIAYIVDTPRTTSPVTFMSNMLYACSILYKTKLPFIVVFNKTDVVSHKFAQDWMTNFDAFQDALNEEQVCEQEYLPCVV